jgi:type IV secretion system protein VirB9
MIRRTIVGVSLLALVGCAPRQQATAPLEPITPPVAQPRTDIPPDPLDALDPVVREAYLSNRTAPTREGFAVFYPYKPHTEPTVYAAASHVTEIELSDDEHVTSATVGDSVRWMVQPERNHVRIKPCPQGCNANAVGAAIGEAVPTAPSSFGTNLIIDTDQPRTYHINLHTASTARAYESFVFWYPDDIAAAQLARSEAMRKAAQEVVDPPARLNFSYRIIGPNVSWKPIQAFDDTSHEYLLFSDSAALQSDMPTLFVNQGKTQEIVNYQVRGNYYVVDRLYSDAALSVGIGTDRQTVRIEATSR